MEISWASQEAGNLQNHPNPYSSAPSLTLGMQNAEQYIHDLCQRPNASGILVFVIRQRGFTSAPKWDVCLIVQRVLGSRKLWPIQSSHLKKWGKVLRWPAKEITLHFSNALITPQSFVKMSLRFLFPAIFLSSLMDSDSSLLDFYRGKLSILSRLSLWGLGWDMQLA